MPLRSLTACALALAFSSHAYAGSRCVDLSIPKAAIEAHEGKWIALTAEQYRFLEGVYVLNPRTNAGLPFGDAAVMARSKDGGDALIFWIDGASACDPMPVPKALVDMLSDIGAGIVAHEGVSN